MKPHDTFLELAAMAIDYPLAPAERGRVEQHLAGCPACARRAAALRADAVTLSNLPAVTLPDRRGSEILAAALHPGIVRHPLRLLAVVALLGLLLVGSLAVGAELLRRFDDDDLSVIPPVPSETTEPDASPVVPVGALAWEEIGTANDGGTLGLVGFDRGYVAYGIKGTPDSLVELAWFSADGRTWEARPLASMVSTCPASALPSDAYAPGSVSDAAVTTSATNGRQVLLAGVERVFTDATCRGSTTGRMVAWISSDGRTWQRSDGFGGRSGPAGVWAVADGWRVADGASGRVWASPDGLEWTDIGMTVGGPVGASAVGAAVSVSSPAGTGPGGTVVAVIYEAPGEGYGVLARWDGQGWVPLDPPEKCAKDIRLLLAPAATGEPWLIAGGQGGPTALCASNDLDRWDAATLPSEDSRTVGALVRTPYGILMSSDCTDDSTCPDSQTWQSLSTDGRTWTELGSSVNAGRFTDGPGGVIALDSQGTVWRLVDTRPVVAPTPAPDPAASPAAGSPAPTGASVGRTWTQATVPVFADRPVDAIGAVTAGGPGFVAVGIGCVEAGEAGSCEGVVLTSIDGRTWDRAPVSDATDIGFAFPMSGPRIGMLDVAAGTPGIVAIGYAARPDMLPTIWFSVDGATWERTSLDPSIRVNAVTWDGRSFVIVGEDRSQATDLPSLATGTARAAIWTSTDGRSWSRVLHSEVLDVGGFIDTMEDPMTGGMRSVVAGPAGLVAVGSVCQSKPAACQPAVWASTDGAAWTRVDGVPNVPGVLKTIAVSGSGFVAVGAQSCSGSPMIDAGDCPALVLTSPDGQTWTQQPFEQPGDLRTITWIGDRFFATAPDGPALLWTSGDGSTWVPAEIEGGPATPDLGFVVEWQLAATPKTAVWLGPAGMETVPGAWVSGAGSAP